MSTRLFAIIPVIVLSAACASEDRTSKTANDVSYTRRTNADTEVVVHPPPPPVSQTETTGAVMLGRTQHKLVTTATPEQAPGRGHEDYRMGESVRAALASEPSLKGVPMERVRVVVIDGHAVLSGAVPTTADSMAIEHKVREIRGVTAVRNELEVLRYR